MPKEPSRGARTGQPALPRLRNRRRGLLARHPSSAEARKRPNPPLPITGEDAANAARAGAADGALCAPSPYIPRGRVIPAKAGIYPIALSVAPPKYRHSGVGRNPFGAKRPQDGAQRAPSPLIPRPRVIPAKAGTYPHDRHSRVGGDLAPIRRRATSPPPPPPPGTSAPCANAPSIPYDGSVARRRRGRKADEAARGALHSAPFLPQTAPFQPQNRPIGALKRTRR